MTFRIGPQTLKSSSNASTGIERTFEDLYKAFRPKIVRYLTRLVGEQESEDLAQEVFIKVNKGLKDFYGKSQLSTWIYRIATNVAIDRLRSPQFKRKDERLSDAEEETEQRDFWSGEKSLSIDEVLVGKEMWECFRDFVNKLSLDQRTVIILADLRGVSNKEIARILDIPLASVKMRLHRGRVKLRKELKAHCGLVRDSRNLIMWEGTRP